MVAPIFETINNIDVRAVLPAIRVPTLILHRRGDRLVDVGNGRYLAGQHPRRPLPRAARRRSHLLRRRRRRAARRDRGVRHRLARHPRPRPRARDGDVHRHRRLDRARGAARRPALARPDGGSRPADARPDRRLPGSHDPQHRRRRVRRLRRPGARDPLRARGGRRRRGRSTSRSAPACTPASASSRATTSPA